MICAAGLNPWVARSLRPVNPGSNGEPEAEALDVEGRETLNPYIVEECKKAPKESFWQKVQTEYKKMFWTRRQAAALQSQALRDTLRNGR